jgi:hypothetical protein
MALRYKENRQTVEVKTRKKTKRKKYPAKAEGLHVIVDLYPEKHVLRGGYPSIFCAFFLRFSFRAKVRVRVVRGFSQKKAGGGPPFPFLENN